MGRRNRRNRHNRIVTQDVVTPDDPCPDEDQYTDMRLHTSAHIKAIAAAEWNAMDEVGRLPAGWVNPHGEVRGTK